MALLTGCWSLRQVVNAVVDVIITRIVQNYDIRAETEMIDGRFVTRWTVQDLRPEVEADASRDVLLSE